MTAHLPGTALRFLRVTLSQPVLLRLLAWRCITIGPPHLLDDLHLFEGLAECVGGVTNRLHGRASGILGYDPRLLTCGAARFSKVTFLLAVLPALFERLALPVANDSRFLSHLSLRFRLYSGALRICWLSLCADIAFRHDVLFRVDKGRLT